MCTAYSRSVPTASTDTIRYVTVYYCPTTPLAGTHAKHRPGLVRRDRCGGLGCRGAWASSYTGFHWRQRFCCELAITGTYTYDKHG